MIYSFDGAIAKEVGVSAAVVFRHIAHWIKFNEVHDQNFINDRYWMYDTLVNMKKFLNFYNEKTIKRSIDKLVEADYLIRDELSPDKYNHTKWYALTEKGIAYANPSNVKNVHVDMDKMSKSRTGQNVHVDMDKMSKSTIIQNNTQSGTQKNTTAADYFCTESPALNTALHDFADMRKKMRKPLTERAKQLILGRLEKLAPGNEREQIAILDQSIERGWQGVFPLKDDTGGRAAVSKQMPREMAMAERVIAMLGDEGDE